MKRALSLLMGLMGLMFVGGCSDYVEGYRYSPHPALAEISSSQPAAPAPSTQPEFLPQMPQPVQAPAQVSTFANIVGVFRGSHKEGMPPSVQVRMRIENRGAQTAVFDPASLDLTDGSLMRFPDPMAQSAKRTVLEPGQSAVVDVFFPFPPGNSWETTDLSSLQLRWAIELNGRPIGQMAEFHRLHPHYYYGGYYPYSPWYGGVGVGFVYVHRR